MIFDILTIFPQAIKSYFDYGILKRAIDENKIKVNFYDLREWSLDKHKNVDDKPYGGGAGMVMMIEPIYRALASIKRGKENERIKTVLLAAKGDLFSQKKAESFLKYDRIIFICGRYEGVDERVRKYLCDEEISIGNYVLSGGELPAAVIVDVVSRQLPGILGNRDSLIDESFSFEIIQEYPQYTRPEKFLNWSVPKVLTSGDHAKIDRWRRIKSKRRK
ncbi:MAG: tRNA (guanosine(37)-N1)-methyltransferase TrmD [Candidatus Moranbacteria bacterium]|nr:tRNA (guanosine(37)-N1)-methyltransferase TrmD [Candidatus Moranbacteria bacterium]